MLFRSPINLCKAKLLADKAITDADVEAMEKEIAAVVQDSWDFADASPEPPLEALYEDVYVETTT